MKVKYYYKEFPFFSIKRRVSKSQFKKVQVIVTFFKKRYKGRWAKHIMEASNIPSATWRGWIQKKSIPRQKIFKLIINTLYNLVIKEDKKNYVL